jgi:hypothetical protein
LISGDRNMTHTLPTQMTAEIGRLLAENEKLQAALQDIGAWSQELQDEVERNGDTLAMWRGCVAQARAALSKE